MKKTPMEEIAVEFVYSRQQEMKTFSSFLYAVATLDVLMANSNDVNLAKTRYVHFA